MMCASLTAVSGTSVLDAPSGGAGPTGGGARRRLVVDHFVAFSHPAHLDRRELKRVFALCEHELVDLFEKHVLGDAGEVFVIGGPPLASRGEHSTTLHLRLPLSQRPRGLR